MKEQPYAVHAALVVGLHLLDVLSTMRAVGPGGGVEGNPLMAWLMRAGNSWLLVKFLAVLGILGCLNSLWGRDYSLATNLAWAHHGFYVSTVFGNGLVYLHHRRGRR